MSVVPGFGGQKFMPEMLKKVEVLKKRITSSQRVEIDGGIHAETIRQAREAGVDWFVVGSGIFEHKDRAAAIRELRNRMGGL
jgi:ribulose-phosphate 3-epimerase